VEKEANRPSTEQQKRLMQSMGQLWLQEEVRSLEQRVSTVVSPLLVPDASALLRHLPQAKQLAASRQFIIVVPTSGQHKFLFCKIATFLNIFLLVCPKQKIKKISS
jgi:hypothetical protein